MHSHNNTPSNPGDDPYAVNAVVIPLPRKHPTTTSRICRKPALTSQFGGMISRGNAVVTASIPVTSTTVTALKPNGRAPNSPT